MRTRIKNLRDRLFLADDRTVFVERFVHLKRAYERFQDEPAEILHAYITNEILSNISIIIDEDDLIVGRINETIPTAKDERLIEKIWDISPNAYGNSTTSQYAAIPEVENRFLQNHPIDFLELLHPKRDLPVPTWYSTFGHVIPDWSEILNKGMNGIKEKARLKLETIKGDEAEVGGKRRFLQAAMISCDAVSNFAKRYAENAQELANSEKDAGRREELIRIKEVCDRVPANPSSILHEAIQSIWFIDLIMHTVLGARDYALGRADQYLYPFYRKDIENGVIDKDDALELIECLFIKLNEFSGIGAHSHGRPLYKYTVTIPKKRSLCVDSIQYCTIGGQTAYGEGAANAVSYLILEAADELRLKQPTVIVRYFRGIDREFWLKACDLARRGLNNLSFYNDEMIIPAYINCGVLAKDAIDYAQIACNHPGLPGRSPQDREYWFNLPKFLELALNDGFDPFIGLQMGPHTGEVDGFKTFYDLLGAFKAQTRYWIERVVQERGEFYEDYIGARPFSFESMLMKDCIEIAMDMNDLNRNPPTGTGYAYHDFLGGGIATVADSLAAIKKLVYDKKMMSLRTLNDILKKNFEGYEKLRLEIVNRFPKYGNDDDYVDSMAADIALFYCHEVVKQRNRYTGLCFPSIYTYHSYASHGTVTGATPDGRKAGEPISENQQAVNSLDRKGLTALLNTMAKLKPAFLFTPSGGSTITIHPSALIGENGAEILSDLIETYFEKGGQHVQTNVVDAETLMDAKEHPEKHRDLVVRVTGYNAYFVTLSPECQDYMIARTAHRA